MIKLVLAYLLGRRRGRKEGIPPDEIRNMVQVAYENARSVDEALLVVLYLTRVWEEGGGYFRSDPAGTTYRLPLS